MKLLLLILAGLLSALLPAALFLPPCLLSKPRDMDRCRAFPGFCALRSAPRALARGCHLVSGRPLAH